MPEAEAGSHSQEPGQCQLRAPPPSVHPSVRSVPSFRPDLRAPHAGARSGGQGWPVFGPPRQRRAASLTAASTTACSPASGDGRPHTKTKSKKAQTGRSKSVLMLSLSRVVLLARRRRQRCHGNEEDFGTLSRQLGNDLDYRSPCAGVRGCLTRWLGGPSSEKWRGREKRGPGSAAPRLRCATANSGRDRSCMPSPDDYFARAIWWSPNSGTLAASTWPLICFITVSLSK